MFDRERLVSDINVKLKLDRISLREASSQIGISVSTLSRFVRGSGIYVTGVALISKWLGVDAGVYFTDETAPPKRPEYKALDPDDVRMLRECGVPERDIEGLNRYVQTIIDERDKFYSFLNSSFVRMEGWAVTLEGGNSDELVISDIDAHLSEYAPASYTYHEPIKIPTYDDVLDKGTTDTRRTDEFCKCHSGGIGDGIVCSNCGKYLW